MVLSNLEDCNKQRHRDSRLEAVAGVVCCVNFSRMRVEGPQFDCLNLVVVLKHH